MYVWEDWCIVRNCLLTQNENSFLTPFVPLSSCLANLLFLWRNTSLYLLSLWKKNSAAKRKSRHACWKRKRKGYQWVRIFNRMPAATANHSLSWALFGPKMLQLITLCQIWNRLSSMSDILSKEHPALNRIILFSDCTNPGFSCMLFSATVESTAEYSTGFFAFQQISYSFVYCKTCHHPLWFSMTSAHGYHSEPLK